MKSKQTLLCAIHDLKFEQPDDWLEKGLPPPACYLCMAEKLKASDLAVKEATSQRDVLLQAITIKTCIPVAAIDRLTKLP